MNKSMCDGPEVRFSSKKCSGGCGGKKKCAKCSSHEEPDRDDTLYSNKTSAQVMTDAMDTHFYRNDGPSCSAGNKPCGNRCIPREYDCNLSQNIRRRHLGYVKNYLGANVAGAGAAGLAYGASKATGGKRAALAAASAVSGLGAAAMGGRALYHGVKYGANQLAQAENEKNGFRKGLRKVVGYGNLGNLVEPDGPSNSKKKKKGRGDSVWAAGFENEFSESL